MVEELFLFVACWFPSHAGYRDEFSEFFPIPKFLPRFFFAGVMVLL